MEFFVTVPATVRQKLGNQASDEFEAEINRVLENVAVKVANETRDRLLPELRNLHLETRSDLRNEIQTSLRVMVDKFNTAESALQKEAHQAKLDLTQKVSDSETAIRKEVTDSRYGNLMQFFWIVVGSGIFLVALGFLAKTLNLKF